MKKLLLLFLLLPIFVKSQDRYFAKDKALHVICSTSIAVGSTKIAYKLNLKNPELIGCGFALSIGIAKEFLYDKSASPKDLLADGVGIVAGYYLNKLIHKKSNARHK